jgi:hypothetical protein
MVEGKKVVLSAVALWNKNKSSVIQSISLQIEIGLLVIFLFIVPMSCIKYGVWRGYFL